MTFLRVDSSARRNSVSRQLIGRFTKSWKKGNPAGREIESDLATTALSLIADAWNLAIHSDLVTLTPAQRETISISDQLVEELLAAAAIVIGAPMYNFTISAISENQKTGDLAEPSRAGAIEQAQLATAATPPPVNAQDLQLQAGLR